PRPARGSVTAEPPRLLKEVELDEEPVGPPPGTPFVDLLQAGDRRDAPSGTVPISRQHADSGWREPATDLPPAPSPGPTPWAIEPLVIDQALAAVVGRWKTTKTYALLDMAISVVTGQRFLGLLTVPRPGPIILVLEESGRNALWRRL